MVNRIKWDISNIAKLVEMWNDEKTDLEIAEFFNTGIYAIGKQRCRLGLTQRKMPKGIKRAIKTKVIDNNDIVNALFYVKDGLNHFSIIDKAKDPIDVARKIMYTQDIKEIIILQPAAKVKQGNMNIVN